MDPTGKDWIEVSPLDGSDYSTAEMEISCACVAQGLSFSVKLLLTQTHTCAQTILS